jgi:TP901 family phage tail tape measure protein
VAVPVGEGVVPIEADFGPLEKGLKGAESSIGSKVGGIAKTVGAAFAASGVMAGAALVKIGSDFDDAFDTIRAGTGATGEALAGLQDDFKQVVQAVPASFGDASTAVADLNTRLGLTGQELQDRSAQFLELSRLTGTDVAANVASVTRVFGDWGVAAEDQSATMDKLFRASQATGIGVDALADKVVQFGAPLRQMGFGFEESIALLGKFEKEGVNGELVMGSMRQALGRLAKAGEDPVKAFRQVSEEIAATGDTSKANALAMELFGARAGPDMAAAIREGRFEIGDLLSTIESGGDTILGVGAETQDFGEKWTMLKNRVFVALQPVATKLFDLIGSGMDRLSGVFDEVAGGVRAFLFAWKAFDGDITSSGFAGFMEKAAFRVRQAFEVLSKIFRERVIPAVKAVAGFVKGTLLPGLLSLGQWIVRNKPVLIGIATAIGVGLVAAFTAWAVSAGAAAVATIAAMAPFIAIGAAIAAVVAAVVWAYTEWDAFRTAVDAVASFLTGTVWPAIQIGADWITGTLIPAIGDVIGWFGQMIGKAAELATKIGEAVGKVVSKVGEIASKIGEVATTVGTKVGEIVGFVTGIPGRIASTVSTMWDGIRTGISTARNWVSDRISEIVGFVSGLTGRITRAAAGMWDGITDAFKAAINTLIRGWNSLEFTIPGFKIGPVGYDGFTLGVPDTGGTIVRPGSVMVGERGPEILNLPRGASVVPLGRDAGGRPIELHFHQSGHDPGAVANVLAWKLADV